MRITCRLTSSAPTVVVISALVVTVACTGCAHSPAPNSPPSAATTATTSRVETAAPLLTATAGPDAAAGYVNMVNGFCGQTMAAVRTVVPNGYAPDTPVGTYRAQASALRAIYTRFDRQFSALPVPPAATQAHAAFTEYVAESDREKQQLLAAAVSGSQSRFAAVMNGLTVLGPGSPIMSRRDAAGFSSDCNYR